MRTAALVQSGHGSRGKSFVSPTCWMPMLIRILALGVFVPTGPKELPIGPTEDWMVNLGSAAPSLISAIREAPAPNLPSHDSTDCPVATMNFIKNWVPPSQYQVSAGPPNLRDLCILLEIVSENVIHRLTSRMANRFRSMRNSFREVWQCELTGDLLSVSFAQIEEWKMYFINVLIHLFM